MKRKTLLERAIELPRALMHSATKDELDVIVAYLNGIITVRQAGKVLGFKNPGSMTHRVATALRWGISKGLVVVKLK